MLTPIGIPQILPHRLVIHNHRQRCLGAISDDAVPLGLAVHFDGLAHLGIQFARVRRDHGFKHVSGLVDPGMGIIGPPTGPASLACRIYRFVLSRFVRLRLSSTGMQYSHSPPKYPSTENIPAPVSPIQDRDSVRGLRTHA